MLNLNSKDASRLLEVLLVFSAGLCRIWKKSAVLDAYPSLFQFQQIYWSIDQQLFRSNGTLPVANIDRLTALLSQYSPRELIIATAHHGHFIAFLNACTRYGLPLSLCYQAASASYIDAAARNKLTLIDLNSPPNVLSLFRTLDRERSNGRYVVIMMDGQFAPRRRYSFLRYQITVSSSASLYP